MSRGFDGPEIDDFHGPESDVNRSLESNSRAGWGTVRRLERIRGEEKRADQRDREARGPAGGNRPPLTREERVHLVLARTSRSPADPSFRYKFGTIQECKNKRWFP
jgi:hypothetical protein